MKNLILISLLFLFSCVDGINTTAEVTTGDPNQIVNVSTLPYTGGETVITNNVTRINIVSL